MVRPLDAASAAALDAPLRRVRLDPPLPCGNAGCGQQATSALVEPDPQHPGLWLAFPLCAACAQRLSQDTSGSPPETPRQHQRAHEHTRRTDHAKHRASPCQGRR